VGGVTISTNCVTVDASTFVMQITVSSVAFSTLSNDRLVLPNRWITLRLSPNTES